MSNTHLTLLYRMLNIWLGGVVILIISSYLPHWENVEPMMWLVYATNLWFLICAIAIAKRDKTNKDVFINISILFAVDGLGYFNMFIGQDYLFGTNNLGYFVYQYHIITFHLLLNFCMVYILIKVLFNRLSYKLRYFYTLLTLLIINCLIFLPYFLKPTHAFDSVQTLFSDLYKRTFHLNILTLLSTLYYGKHVYKNNRILGEYINPLVAYFFIYLFADLIDNLSMIYNFQIYNIRLYFVSLNFIFLSYILFKKLVYTYSDFGQFYESLIAGGHGMGNVKIIPRNQASHSLTFQVLKIYIYQRRHFIMTLVMLVALAIMLFELPVFFTLNLIALFAGLGIIYSFYASLYKKREKQKTYL